MIDSELGKADMAADRRIDIAKAFHFEGRTVEAESLYRAILNEQPHSLDALEGLGVLVFQRGNVEEASFLFARGVAIDPSRARFHANLGEALRTLRRLDEALDHLRKAVALDPADVPAWNSLGLVAFDSQRYSAALRAYREAIRLQPRFVPAYINLANSNGALGQRSEAIRVLRLALQCEPNNALALSNLGRILCEMNDARLLPEAESVTRRALSIAPQSLLSRQTLERVLRLKGQRDWAVGAQQQAVAADALGFSGLCQTEALVVVEQRPARAAQVSPAQAQATKGLAHLAEGQIDQAEECLRQALVRDPAMVDAWLALATIQSQRGQFDQSCQSARAALAVRPDVAEAYWRLASNLRGNLPDDDRAAMETLAASAALCNDDRALVLFGLAMDNDRRGLFDQAAAQHDSANMQQSAGKSARGLVHNPDRHSWFIDKIIASFSSEFLACRRDWGVADVRPVFVVGFPRSGTTLVEQVLASHPQVTGAGELLELHYVFQSLPALVGLDGGNAFEALALLGPDSVKAAANRYLARLQARSDSGATHVVDKMPDNIMQLGLIALLLPRAKVIVCHRDPRDIAVSCWQTGFRSSSWNNDWDHIARRLADHQRIVDHWWRVQPMEYLDLQYEDLVTDPERHSRSLIEYIGLDWDPSCLDFHSRRHVVRTPSLVQVREPIHVRSCGRWRHYQGSLSPMFTAFERHRVDVPTVE